MNTSRPVRHPRTRPGRQQGAYLLEALIGILIFSFGILGIVGLQAQAIRFTNDSEFRAEAVYLANGLISQMWTANQATLQANYRSPGGIEYLNFKTLKVAPAFGAMMTKDPDVLVNDASLPSPPSTTSSVVQVTIYWTLPGDTTEHRYTTTGVVGQN
jgi:type IV pilus assembly protein PilV